MTGSRATAWVLAVLSLACGPEALPTMPPPPPSEALLPQVTGKLLRVTGVQVLIAESFPPQVHALVRGELPDYCHAIDAIVQGRQDRLIVVLVTIKSREGACALPIVVVEERVPLVGPLPPGDYVLRVNGVDTRFRL